MRAASTLSVIGIALLFLLPDASAIGIGRISNTTQLGQTLNFVAPVRLAGDEALPRECVFAEVQSGENNLPAGQVRVVLEGAIESSNRSVRVTTLRPIDEPVVTVTVTLGCLAKYTRSFVTFVDPPVILLAQSAPLVSDAPPAAPPEPSPVAAVVAAVPPVPPSAAPARSVARRSDATEPPRKRVRARPTATSTPTARRAAPASKVAAAAPSTRRVRLTAAAPSSEGAPRLQLEAAPFTPPAGASTPLPAPVPTPVVADASASAPPADDSAAASAQERQRMRALEDGLAALRSDSASAQKSIAALQLRLKEAESRQYANPLVYALAWLSALLALAVAALWWRQSRARESAQWWAPPSQVMPLAAPAPVVPADEALDSGSPLTDAVVVANEIDDPYDEDIESLPAVPVAVPVATPATEPSVDLSIEELLDLDQQAEFFVALGQDAAAVELLMPHVRSSGGSVLPYLMLLELYRRSGEKEPHERIRERFNRRFDAVSPAWDEHGAADRDLLEYPEIVTRLQELWHAPNQVLAALNTWLLRPQASETMLDLPAYRELLFLYPVVRDLAERDAPDVDIDLLLPFPDDARAPVVAHLLSTTAVTRLRGTGPKAPFDGAERISVIQPLPGKDPGHLDFDLDALDDLPRADRHSGTR